jgi:pantetheine-phosphate adenylyltransferase
MKFKKVAVGGSFDLFHKGHEALLEKAFDVGEFVTVGLTSDEMVSKDIEPYPKRKETLDDFLSKFRGRYKIIKLQDPYGDAANDEKIEALVVSQETEPRAREINEIRRMNGLPTLEAIVVPLVLAEDGKPISSTRIRKGEIDRRGKILYS